MREETIKIELTVPSSYFNSGIMRPNRQSSIALKLMNYRYQRGKIIRRITIRMFIEKVQEGYLLGIYFDL